MDIFQALKSYADQDVVRFHMPGHKGRLHIGADISALDVTELYFSDNLMQPTGIIQKAEEKAAAHFASRHTFLGTGGATACIYAALSIFQGKGVILAEKAAHVSFWRAAEFLRLPVRCIQNRYQNGIALPISWEDISRQSLDNVACVFFTSPNYYGMTVKEDIARYLAEKNIPLIVDAAHGAHFGAHSALPGLPQADLVIHSGHKTLPVLNQGAYFSVYNADLQKSAERAFRIFQSTSPSYPILATLERAVDWLDGEGKAAYDALCRCVLRFRQEINAQLGEVVGWYDDFSRIYVQAFGCADRLEEAMIQSGIVPEFQDGDRVILIATPYNTQRDFDRLAEFLIENYEKIVSVSPPNGRETETIPVQVAMPYVQAMGVPESEKEWVALSRASGRIAACNVGNYPPAVPLIVAGERFTPQAIGRLRANAFGCQAGSVQVICEKVGKSQYER